MCKYAAGCLRCHYSNVSVDFIPKQSIAMTAGRTGIHIIASTFLLPVGVAIYTFIGGIKATYGLPSPAKSS